VVRFAEGLRIVKPLARSWEISDDGLIAKAKSFA
jgi:hypothetical protein